MNKIQALQQIKNYFDCKDSLIVGLWSSATVFYPTVDLALFKLQDKSVLRVLCHYNTLINDSLVYNANIISHKALLRLIPLIKLNYTSRGESAIINNLVKRSSRYE